MVGLAGVIATGCGSDGSTDFTPQAQQQLRELIIIPNAATDSVSVRGIDTHAGGGAFIGIDPTNSLIYSAANSGTTLAGARRLADGTLQAAPNSPFTGNLSTPFVFDFFQFVQ